MAVNCALSSIFSNISIALKSQSLMFNNLFLLLWHATVHRLGLWRTAAVSNHSSPCCDPLGRLRTLHSIHSGQVELRVCLKMVWILQLFENLADGAVSDRWIVIWGDPCKPSLPPLNLCVCNLYLHDYFINKYMNMLYFSDSYLIKWFRFIVLLYAIFLITFVTTTEHSAVLTHTNTTFHIHFI